MLLNPWRFSSEYADDSLALVYYNYRHYEPVNGRWSVRDPIYEKGGCNLYTLCINRSDLFDCLGLAVLSLPNEPYFDDVSGKNKYQISRYVTTVNDPLKKIRNQKYFYRVAFIARFSPPREVDNDRIKPNKISEIIIGSSASAFGGEEGMYKPNSKIGDIPVSAWGTLTSVSGGHPEGPFKLRGERTYIYSNKKFQFGYFVYISRNGNAFTRIDFNPDMYARWYVGGLRRLLPEKDISTYGKMGTCDIIVIYWGDKGIKPQHIVIMGPGVRE